MAMIQLHRVPDVAEHLAAVSERADDWERYYHGDTLARGVGCDDDVCMFVRSLLDEVGELRAELDARS